MKRLNTETTMKTNMKNTDTTMTTTIFGTFTKVLDLCDKHGSKPFITETDVSDGGSGTRRVTGTARTSSFRGGYDDYDGALCWAVVTAQVSGSPQRFSPAPGEHRTGVRV